MATPTTLPRGRNKFLTEMATVAVQPKVEHPTKDPGRAVSKHIRYLDCICSVYVAVGQKYCYFTVTCSFCTNFHHSKIKTACKLVTVYVPLVCY